MKKLITAAILSIAYFSGFSQEKKLDSAEIKYLTKQLQDEYTTVGVFEIPDITSPIKTLNGNYTPELDDEYIKTVINYNILKLYTLETVKGNIESMIFMKIPTPDLEGPDNLQFFSFPGTKWLLFLQPCVITSKSGTITQGWVKRLKGTYADYKFITEKSTFDLISSSHTSYATYWPKDIAKPPQIILLNQEFIKDLNKVISWMKTWQNKPQPEKANALKKLEKDMKTKEGQILCYYLSK